MVAFDCVSGNNQSRTILVLAKHPSEEQFVLKQLPLTVRQYHITLLSSHCWFRSSGHIQGHTYC